MKYGRLFKSRIQQIVHNGNLSSLAFPQNFKHRRSEAKRNKKREKVVEIDEDYAEEESEL